MRSIDLNCDLGEGAGKDEWLMPLITSANIACGGHAGDENTMRETVRLAAIHGVSIGAHPGYADREHFGRRECDLTTEEIFDLVRSQLFTLQEIAEVEGRRIVHVKPHGALYNQAARNREIATAVGQAVRSVDHRLILYGLAGSALIEAGRECGLATASEVFADRTYTKEGKLTPRSHPEAVITDFSKVVRQVMSMLCEGEVASVEGMRVPIAADTICLHGDGPDPVGFAKEVRSALTRAGIELRSTSIKL